MLHKHGWLRRLVARLGVALLMLILAGADPRSGPAALAQGGDRYHWLTMNGPVVPGGAIAALAVAPSAPDTVYALANDRLFRSTDAAGQWQQIYSFVNYVHKIAVNPGDPSMVYAATSGPLYRSTDAGRSWAPVSTPGWAMAAPTLTRIYAGGHTPVPDPRCPNDDVTFSYSDDGGATWQSKSLGCLGTLFQIAALPGDRQGVYIWGVAVGTEKCAYLKFSPDGGQTWEDLPVPSLSFSDAMLLDPVRPRHVFLSGGRIWRSSDGGHTWQDLAVPWPGTALGGHILASGSDGLLYAAAHDAGSPTPIFASQDGGDTWRAGLNDLPSGIAALTTDPQRPYVYASLGGAGVMRSVDAGNSWHEANSGITTLAQVAALAVGGPAATPRIYAGGGWSGHGLFESSDLGRTWRQVLPGTAVTALAADPRLPGLAFAGTTTGLYARSDAGGWSGEYTLSGIYDVALAPSDPTRAYAASAADGRGLVLRRVDAGAFPGAAWASAIISGSYRVTGVAVDPHDAEIVYAGAFRAQPGVYKDSAVYRSQDGGLTWQKLSPDFYLFSLHIAVDPTDGQKIYAGGSADVGGIYRSSDGGRSWQAINAGLPALLPNITALRFDPAGVLYAATMGGVYQWQAGPETWVPFGLQGQIVWDVGSVGQAEPRLLAGTGNGVWQLLRNPPTVWLPGLVGR
jgi:photosystem II stability/assembly factor-like uncharacterized protein